LRNMVGLKFIAPPPQSTRFPYCVLLAEDSALPHTIVISRLASKQKLYKWRVVRRLWTRL
jgi:hypothetical protein